ncbi:hypothetical protein MPSEU_000054800 [Mayamaea pseudoterrestris]|nr:hypothetical protein MPSEU_000054800 [Mayamaea pseudoterrestris]
MRLAALAFAMLLQFAPGVFGFVTPAHSLSTINKHEDSTTSLSSSLKQPTWQADLDELVSPLTPPGRRQILLQELLNANQEIRASVQKALQDRNIDPLLTPTQRKLQAGTQAVARQLANDILPSLAQNGPPSDPLSLLPSPDDLQKVGSSVLAAIGNQLQRNFEILQSDLVDPATRIPQRLSKQTKDLVKEAQNVLRDTPVGLQEPPYTVVAEAADYEIRDYAAYTVACTNMATVQGESSGDSIGENGSESASSITDVGQSGAAFNSLAAYLFGANAQGQSMDMTTPVTTTFQGEMRFYLASPSVPAPLDASNSNNPYETGRVWIQNIPAARLAVRRFTGFVTDGEIARQKESLLLALQLDGVELDVAHGQTVGHVIFQYNPPYTIPVMRRNEIAVPVLRDLSQNLDDAWQVETEE